MGKINKKKGYSLLNLKVFHESHLVLMDVLHREGILVAFLGIEAHRNALDCSDVVDGTLLLEVGQGYMTGCLINLNGRNGSWNLLNKRQLLLLIDGIGLIDVILQFGTA